MTNEQLLEAIRRLAIIAEWDALYLPVIIASDGTQWLPESEKFEVEACVIAVLDNEKVIEANLDAPRFLMEALFDRVYQP